MDPAAHPKPGAQDLTPWDAAKLGYKKAGRWSHDGTWHINRYGGEQKGPFRLNVLTGERLTLYVPPPGCRLGFEALALSPDETLLAFQVFQPEPEQPDSYHHRAIIHRLPNRSPPLS